MRSRSNAPAGKRSKNVPVARVVDEIRLPVHHITVIPFKHRDVVHIVSGRQDDPFGRIDLDVAGFAFPDNPGHCTSFILYKLNGGSGVVKHRALRFRRSTKRLHEFLIPWLYHLENRRRFAVLEHHRVRSGTRIWFNAGIQTLLNDIAEGLFRMVNPILEKFSVYAPPALLHPAGHPCCYATRSRMPPQNCRRTSPVCRSLDFLLEAADRSAFVQSR